MTSWLGQLVITKSTTAGKSPFKVHYWRTPSITPAFMTFATADDLERYLRHCRLTGVTPEEIVARLRTQSELTLSTIESEEKVS